MRKQIFIVLILVLVAGFGALLPATTFAQSNIVVAQNNGVTLWDLLFGPKKKTVTTRRTKPAPPPRTSLPEVVPDVEKSPDATRLAVFGDSLAVDLAKALKRFYSEDPNLMIIGQGVGSSGFVRDDFFDWSGALRSEIEADNFDIAVIIMGINDRQNLMVDGTSEKPLTDGWKKAYSARLAEFLGQLRRANKPVIWIGMPPMASPKYSASITQISSLQQLATFAGGAEFINIYERFTDENGKYSSRGPDINGQDVLMRKSDGIHFSKAGSDKLAFYINQSLKLFYRGGTISLAVVDPLEGTDAQSLQRLPLQGLGQLRLLEVAGAVMSLSNAVKRADELMLATDTTGLPPTFRFDKMTQAPVGRVDAFGVGVELGGGDEEN